LTFVATYVGLVGLAVIVIVIFGLFGYWCYWLWSNRSDPGTSWKAGLTLLIIVTIVKGLTT
jgi:hypothetical protein